MDAPRLVENQIRHIYPSLMRGLCCWFIDIAKCLNDAISKLERFAVKTVVPQMTPSGRL
jgi:hypothetical protein